MDKPWLVWDSGNGNIEEFATEQEAVHYAEEALAGYRDQAKSDGEWADEADQITVYKRTHSTQIVSSEMFDDGECIDYGIRPAP